jgi:hypothetical protein
MVMAGSVDTQLEQLRNKYAHSLGRFKKSDIRREFVDISTANLALVGDVLQRARDHKAKKRYKEAEMYLDIANKLLDNNEKFQKMVGKILANGS